MDLAEFQSEGYLQEVNRRFLHPLGLALAVNVAADGAVTFAGIYDDRDDPEGIYFDGVDLAPAAKTVALAEGARSGARTHALGYWVQPVKPTREDGVSDPVADNG